MENEEETNELVELMNRLSDERGMIGWLCTVHKNKVQLPNQPDPEVAKGIQEQLSRASNLISLAYIWALLDESGFNERSKWISTQDRLELKAWKHIRHTGAHAPSGRAKVYYDEFDEFMSAATGTSGLKENCRWTTDRIDLTDGMNYRFFEWVRGLIQNAVAYCAGDNAPE